MASLSMNYVGTAAFSDAIIDRFFRAYFGGVPGARSCHIKSLVSLALSHLCGGGGAIPALGMQAIPNQLANALPRDSIRLNSAVERIDQGDVVLANGERITSRAVVVATDGPRAAKLLGDAIPDGGSRGTVTLWFAANRSPLASRFSYSMARGEGPVNNVVTMSDASSAYAPAGQSLIAASIIGVPTMTNTELEAAAKQQLQNWFSTDVNAWRLLRVDRIPHALPDQRAGKLEPWQKPVRLKPGLYVCGDHRDQGSIDGALASGFRVAQAVAEDLAANRV